MMDRLTPAAARDARPGDVIRDHEVKGLQLRCTATKKAWYLYYRSKSGLERRPKLGNYPELSLTAARDAARALLQQIAAGEDPSAKWQTAREAPTVDQLCDRYLSDWASLRKSAGSVKEDQLLIDTHIRPGLGSRRVTDVTRADVDKFLTDVYRRKYVDAARKGRDGKRTAPGAANHVRALLSKMFMLACDEWELRPPNTNPVRKSTEFETTPRKRKAEPAELGRLLKGVLELANRQPKHAAVLLALFLTGARRGEILNATVGEWHGRVLILKNHKTKRWVGDKEIPLPRPVRDVLEHIDAQQPNRPDSASLFGVRSIRKTWERLRDECGCPDLELRDVRRTVASYGISYAGASLTDIGQLFGHTNSQTTMRYAHMVGERKGELADKIAAAILEIAQDKG